MKIEESTVIQSILLLDWHINNESVYFVINMDANVLNRTWNIHDFVCVYAPEDVFLHVSRTKHLEANRSEICRVSYTCSGTEQ